MSPEDWQYPIAEVDAALAAAYSNIALPSSIRHNVLRRAKTIAPPRRPSFVPEVLDFVGWAAVVAICVFLVRQTVLF